MRIKTAAGLVALTCAAAVAAAPAAADQVPWGAGCLPVAEGATRVATNCGAELVEGTAIAPPEAPAVVKRVIAAANRIDETPYVWGGGHRSFYDSRGYDCSGAVGYALHGGGLLATTMVSGQLAKWGEPGPGRWISIYANDEHVFMVVAGLRFDTRSNPIGIRGPRWKMASAEASILPRFRVRHPMGL
ncbi:MAG: hypothetical protein U0R71_09115 [Solirubrobacterales bacterium]